MGAYRLSVLSSLWATLVCRDWLSMAAESSSSCRANSGSVLLQGEGYTPQDLELPEEATTVYNDRSVPQSTLDAFDLKQVMTSAACNARMPFSSISSRNFTAAFLICDLCASTQLKFPGCIYSTWTFMFGAMRHWYHVQLEFLCHHILETSIWKFYHTKAEAFAELTLMIGGHYPG